VSPFAIPSYDNLEIIACHSSFLNPLMSTLYTEIVNGPGFTIIDFLSSDQLAQVRELVTDHFFSVVAANHLSQDFMSLALLSTYHTFKSSANHGTLWTKSNRILPNSHFLRFLATSSLFERFGALANLSITDEDNIGYGNVYWRLVRPFHESDVGPLHCDQWFWLLNKHHTMPKGTNTRLKLWAPLFSDLGKNGLLVEPFSHIRDDIKWVGEFRHGIHKPVLLTDPSSFNLKLLHIQPGQAILFHDKLIHGGALNKSVDSTRVSVELTLAFDL
jgi:hypothetical protein